MGRSESEPVGKTTSKWSGEKSPTILNWYQFWPVTCVLSEKYFLLTFLIGLSHKAYCPFLLENIDMFFNDARNNKMPISVWCNKFSYSDEINRLNERLREKGVDIETERKLEQVSIKEILLNLFHYALIQSFTYMYSIMLSSSGQYNNFSAERVWNK